MSGKNQVQYNKEAMSQFVQGMGSGTLALQALNEDIVKAATALQSDDLSSGRVADGYKESARNILATVDTVNKLCDAMVKLLESAAQTLGDSTAFTMKTLDQSNQQTAAAAAAMKASKDKK